MSKRGHHHKKMLPMFAIGFYPVGMSADHPYAVDLWKVFAARDRLRHMLMGWSSKQIEETSTDMGFILFCEAFRMHEKALNARDWDSIDVTLHQLWRAFEEYDRQHRSKSRKRFSMLEARRDYGAEGGRKIRKTLSGEERPQEYHPDNIIRDYDALIQEKSRPFVVKHLANKYKVAPNTINKMLSNNGRGTRQSKKQDNHTKK
jgi:hypothetical protein